MRLAWCLVLAIAQICVSERVPIKINIVQEPTTTTTTSWANSPQTTYTYSTPSPAPSAPDVYREVDALALPPSLDTLTGVVRSNLVERWTAVGSQCFSLTDPQYIYELCPFQNITQRSRSSSLHVVLGLWGSWLTGQDDEHGLLTQVYTDGNACASGKRRQTHVHLECPSETETQADSGPSIDTVDEPRGCEYTVNFRHPLACDAIRAAREQGYVPPRILSTTQLRSEWKDQQMYITRLETCVTYLTDATAAEEPNPCVEVVQQMHTRQEAAKAEAEQLKEQAAERAEQQRLRAETQSQDTLATETEAANEQTQERSAQEAPLSPDLILEQASAPTDDVAPTDEVNQEV